MRKWVLLAGVSAAVLSTGARAQQAGPLTALTPKPPVTFVDRNGVDLRSGQMSRHSLDITIGEPGNPVFHHVAGRRGSSAATGSVFSGVLSRMRCTQDNAAICNNWIKAEFGSSTEWLLNLSGEFNNQAGVFLTSDGGHDVVVLRNGERLVFDAGRAVEPVDSNSELIELGRLLRIERSDGEIIEVGGVPGTPYYARSSRGYGAMSPSVGRARFVNLARAYCASPTACTGDTAGLPELAIGGASLTAMIEDAVGNQVISTVQNVGGANRFTVQDRTNRSYVFDMKASHPGTAVANYSVSRYEQDGQITTYQYTQTGSSVWSDTTISRVVATYPDGSTLTRNGDSLWVNNEGPTILEYGHAIDPYGSAGSNGQIRGITYPEGNIVSYDYDSRGNVTVARQVSKDGSTTLTTTAQYPVACANSKICNSPTAVIDANGGKTDFTYDPVHGGVLTETSPAGLDGIRPQKRFTYTQIQGRQLDASGAYVLAPPIWRLTAVSQCRTQSSCAGTADEVITSYGYDDNLIRNRETVRLGSGTLLSETNTTFDAAGNPISVDGPAAGQFDTIVTFYDRLRQVTATVRPDPDGGGALTHPAELFTRDAEGRVLQRRIGTVTAQTAAALGAPTIQLTETTDYDSVGRPTVVRRAAGPLSLVNQTSYDAAGRVSCVATRMNPAAFNALPANACSHTQAGPHGPDRITRSVYDAEGQLIQTRRAVGTSLEQAYATYTYTPNGQRQQIIDANGNRASLTYDGFDRQIGWYFPTHARPSGWDGSTVATALATAGAVSGTDYEAYGYDANGNRTSFRRRDGRTLTFAYDALNRVTSKIVPDACVAGFACTAPPADATRDVYYGYDLQGLQTYARFDGHSGPGLTHGFDGLGRLVTETTTLTGSALVLAYEYDAHGNRTRITHPDATTFAYEYDGLDRLTRIRDGSGTELTSYVYDNALRLDSMSNGAAIDVQYDALGRLTSLAHDFAGTSRDTSKGFGHNAAGQVVERTLGNAQPYTFNGFVNVDRHSQTNGLNQYTQSGNLPLSYDANGNLTGWGNVTYTYDAENRMVGSNQANSSLRWDPIGRLYETTIGGVTTRFLYSRDELIGEYDPQGNLISRYVHGAGIDDPLVVFTGAVRRHLQSDHQGSIFATSDASGTIRDINSYDEFGLPGPLSFGRFRYTGQAWLPGVNLYHYKARVYSPTLGRFLQTDPIGYDDQVNLYAYVANDPVNGRDPTGLQDTSIERAIERDNRALLTGQITEEEYRDRANARGMGVVAGAGVLATLSAGGRAGAPLWSLAARAFGIGRAAAPTIEAVEATLPQGVTRHIFARLGVWRTDGGAAAAAGRSRAVSSEAIQGLKDAGVTRSSIRAWQRFYQGAVETVRSDGTKIVNETARYRSEVLDNVLRSW